MKKYVTIEMDGSPLRLTMGQALELSIMLEEAKERYRELGFEGLAKEANDIIKQIDNDKDFCKYCEIG